MCLTSLLTSVWTVAGPRTWPRGEIEGAGGGLSLPNGSDSSPTLGANSPSVLILQLNVVLNIKVSISHCAFSFYYILFKY